MKEGGEREIVIARPRSSCLAHCFFCLLRFVLSSGLRFGCSSAPVLRVFNDLVLFLARSIFLIRTLLLYVVGSLAARRLVRFRQLDI